MGARVVAMTPTLKPVGGVVKVFDYAEHLADFGYRVTIATDDEFDPELPLFRGDRFRSLWPGPEVSYSRLKEIGLAGDDWVLFSWPTHYEIIATILPPDYDPRRVIHLVQNVRHANPSWLGGYATRLLTRPMSRVFVASPVLERCQRFLHQASPSTVIPEGHRWEFFHKRREGDIGRPMRVGYTTWKSEVGHRVARELEGDETFKFRAITQPASWDDLADLYQNIDVFLGTPGPEEGFYLPGLEAMAAGAILIIPDAGGNLEYCHFDRNCLETPLEDEAGYVRQLRRIERGEIDVEKMRDDGYSTLDQHTIAAEREEFRAFLGSLNETLTGSPLQADPI